MVDFFDIMNFVFQFFKDDLMYYANRVGGSSTKEALQIYQTENQLPEKPSRLFCKPQSEAMVAEVLSGLTDGMGVDMTVEDLLQNFAMNVEPLVDLLWEEHCNVYLIESNVSCKKYSLMSITKFLSLSLIVVCLYLVITQNMKKIKTHAHSHVILHLERKIPRKLETPIPLPTSPKNLTLMPQQVSVN